MKPSAVSLLFLILCSHVLSSKSKIQQQPSAADDDDDDDEDWDEDDEDDYINRKSEVDDDGRIYKNPRNSPSAMCPRDEEQAELLGQKCLRKCSTDEDCKSKKKKCRCDGACGMSCIKPDRECPELTDIDHGGMTVTGKLFGDRAQYGCDPHFFIVGLSERSCRADGHWTGTTPACKKESSSFCKEPPKIKNARHNALVEQTTFDLDSTVQYSCYHGYATNGFPRAKCLMMVGAASWFGPDISCEPQSCGTPTDIANGWHAGECYTYDCRVSYHCADGYELVGRAEKICLAEGVWTPKELPQCVQITAVQCPPPESPRDGKAVYTSCSYNSIVSYECKYGYTIVGTATRRCGADRRWSGQTPQCKEINCGHPGVLYNGWIENIESGTALGASIIFRCDEHMKLEGNTSSVCQIDGRWRYPLPQCLAPCVLPQIEKGHIKIASHDQDHINNVTVVEHGEKLYVDCVKNHEFAANSTPVLCNNGTWSIIPKCSPARCKLMPKAPRNGMVIAPKTDHGMRAVFKCKDGYELNGTSRFVQCSYGNWTGEIPSCEEVFCPFPGYITNGKVLLVGNMGVYDYRPYVRKVMNNKQIMYDCDRGFVLSEGPPGATCVGGTWRPKELPRCIPGQHPRLRWSRRRRSSGGSNATINYKKIIEFFKKISKKFLHLDTNRPRNRTKHGTNGSNGWKMNHKNETVQKKHSTHRNNSQMRDEKMISFLEVIYQKLLHIESKQARNQSSMNMHDLLNIMSKNFFHVDLDESRRNASGKSTVRAGFKVRNQKEFAKLKKGFEKITRFYNKSLQWSEKQNRKKMKKMTRPSKAATKKSMHQKHKKHQTRTQEDKYKGFYRFMNNYLEEKLTKVEAQNATEELIRKLNINKFTIKNGTIFTIGEIYAFFKHIIENKVTPDGITSKSNTTAESKTVTNDNQAVSFIKNNPLLDNEIPPLSKKNTTLVNRSERTRKPFEETASFRQRKLLSLDYPLSNKKSDSNFVEGEYRISRNLKSKQLTLNELQAQQQNHLKRFLPPSEIDNQIFLKNLYLNAYEDEYRANIKRSILQSNRTSWTAVKRRKDNLENFEVK